MAAANVFSRLIPVEHFGHNIIKSSRYCRQNVTKLPEINKDVTLIKSILSTSKNLRLLERLSWRSLAEKNTHLGANILQSPSRLADIQDTNVVKEKKDFPLKDTFSHGDPAKSESSLCVFTSSDGQGHDTTFTEPVNVFPNKINLKYEAWFPMLPTLMTSDKCGGVEEDLCGMDNKGHGDTGRGGESVMDQDPSIISYSCVGMSGLAPACPNLSLSNLPCLEIHGNLMSTVTSSSFIEKSESKESTKENSDDQFELKISGSDKNYTSVTTAEDIATESDGGINEPTCSPSGTALKQSDIPYSEAKRDFRESVLKSSQPNSCGSFVSETPVGVDVKSLETGTSLEKSSGNNLSEWDKGKQIEELAAAELNFVDVSRISYSGISGHKSDINTVSKSRSENVHTETTPLAKCISVLPKPSLESTMVSPGLPKSQKRKPKSRVLPESLLASVEDNVKRNCLEYTKEVLAMEAESYPSSEAVSTVSEMPFADLDVSGLVTKNNSKDQVYDVSALFSDKYDKQFKKFVQERRNQRKRKREQSKQADNKNETEEQKHPKRPRKLPPNYFVAVQITNPEIHQALAEVQKSVMEANAALKSVMVSLSTIHLTLMAMRLNDQADILRASVALEVCAANLRPLFETGVPDMEITGLGTFRDQVVFAKVKPSQSLEHLKMIAGAVKKCMVDNSVLSADSREFQPHITIMKMSKVGSWFRKKVTKKIDLSLYEEFVEMHFGTERLMKLQLCSMHKPKDKSGYYHIAHDVELGPGSRELTPTHQLSQSIVKLCITAGVEKLKNEEKITKHGKTEDQRTKRWKKDDNSLDVNNEKNNETVQVNSDEVKGKTAKHISEDSNREVKPSTITKETVEYSGSEQLDPDPVNKTTKDDGGDKKMIRKSQLGMKIFLR